MKSMLCHRPRGLENSFPPPTSELVSGALEVPGGETPLDEMSGVPASCSVVQTRAESDRNGIFQQKRKAVSTQLNPYAKEYKPRAITPGGEGGSGEGSDDFPVTDVQPDAGGAAPPPSVPKSGRGRPRKILL